MAGEPEQTTLKSAVIRALRVYERDPALRHKGDSIELSFPGQIQWHGRPNQSIQVSDNRGKTAMTIFYTGPENGSADEDAYHEYCFQPETPLMNGNRKYITGLINHLATLDDRLTIRAHRFQSTQPEEETPEKKGGKKRGGPLGRDFGMTPEGYVRHPELDRSNEIC